MNKTKRKFTARQKRAYWLGVGMAIGEKGGSKVLLNNFSDTVRKSICNGYEKELSTKPASRSLRGRK